MKQSTTYTLIQTVYRFAVTKTQSAHDLNPSGGDEICY